MKRPFARVLALLLTVLMLLALTACQGQAPASSAVSVAESSAAEPSGAEASAAPASSESSASGQETSAATPYATMEEYVATSEMQQAIESIRSTVDSSLMTVELAGEGNRLIYNFTYQNLEGQDLAALGDALKKTLEGEDMITTYRNIAQALKPVVAVDDPVVVVNYRTPDGTLLAGKEYTAD